MGKYKEILRIPFESTFNNTGKGYAGIGSRGLLDHESHEEVKGVMVACGYYLALMGYCLRSGGAEGPDEFFELGTDLAIYTMNKGEKEIFLPWKGFRSNPSHLIGSIHSPEIMKKMIEIASVYHPGWNAEKFRAEQKGIPYKLEESYEELTTTYKKMMARNVCQIQGINLDNNVKFVLCWTEDGVIDREHRTKNTGGTGQAIAIASDLGISVYNLKREDHMLRIKEGLKKWENIYGPVPDPSILPYKRSPTTNKKFNR